MKNVYPEKPIDVPEEKKPKNRLFSILPYVMGALIYYFLIKPFFN